MDLNNIEIQIFVSCPKDVNSEKGIVKEVCERVNRTLLHIGCSIHIAFRDFSDIIGPTGVRPQQLINDSIVGYNIYLGILHMRFGTPTGAINPITQQEFESGTEEEFEIACERHNVGEEPSMIYFFFKDQIGSKTSEENKQAGKVLQFKERISSKNWVTSFKTDREFENVVYDLLIKITGKLCIAKLTEGKQYFLKEGLHIQTTDLSSAISAFVPALPDLAYYIPRSITLFKKSTSIPGTFSKEEVEKILLRDILLQEKRIALLGNAGSGKSVELQQTAKYFLVLNTPFIPIYKRFNIYTNENIEDFLPDGWDKINPKILVVLLDGLDEIQPQYFNIAVRRIINFTERNPNLRIVVSCRTNFYELPDETFSGTLTDFQVYILNDISLSETKDYITDQFKINGERFIQEAYQNTFLDLIRKPFFLNILLKYYKENENFTGGRLRIIEDFVLSRIELDKEHFKGTDILKTKSGILSLLEKVAFVMELVGKNFINDEELESILVEPGEVDQIKHFSAFAKDTQRNQWMFEHNNIQEFLASKVLGRQSFERFIEIISFSPLYNKIRPTWVNTISFFISSGDAEIVDKLIEWLVDKEPESIVKFEPDRINKELRLQLFKRIFNFYKQKNIWLNSNKFNHAELSRFASSTEAIEFLITEIQDQSNTWIVRLNAISVLENFDLNDFDISYKEKIKTVLKSILGNEEPDTHIVQSILYSMGRMNMTDPETIEHLVSKYGKRKNQYIRAGLYKLINESNYIEQYVDVFLEGLMLNEMENAIEDRENVSLADESWLLEEGLKKLKSPTALRKALSHFENPHRGRKLEIYNHGEIYANLLQNTIKAYKDEPSLFKEIYNIYITAGRSHDGHYAEVIISFLEKAGIKWGMFKSIWNDETVKGFDKDFLLEPLLDKAIVDSFIKAFTDRNFTNHDAVRLHKLLSWHFPPNHEQVYLVETFEKKIEELFDLKMERPQMIDWAVINKRKRQESFNLLFDGVKMLKEVQNIFTKIGKEELGYDDLLSLQKDDRIEMNDYSLESTLDLLRDFTSNGKKVQYTNIEIWIKGFPDFKNYQIAKIYQHLHGSRDRSIEVNQEQIDFITKWCYEVTPQINIENAIYTKGNENDSFSVNSKAIYLWFFINYFSIPLPKNKLLEFTLFCDFENQNNSSTSATIEKLEHFLDKNKIGEKVIENLSKDIPVFYVWTSNAAYAINNNLKKSFSYVLRDLKNSSKSEHHRSQILDLYFKKTKNFEALRDILKSISSDQLIWEVVKLLIEHKNQYNFLREYLSGILQNEYELLDYRMNAAKYLMHLNDLSGLNFIANMISESLDPNLASRHLLYTLTYIQTTEAIPVLIRLLKIAKQPVFQQDSFNNLESFLFDTLYNIGVQSEKNFLMVKTALEAFIEENKGNFEHLNFIHFNIRKIEEQLYLKKSQAFSISEAIKEFEKLNH